MRYLGNKETILPHIRRILLDKGLLDKKCTFFDAFCGTGTVADYLKKELTVLINDNLTWATIYSKGRIVANTCSFHDLGFDPFEFLNSSNTTVEGFNYNNYSPAKTDRMYFTEYNAGRIDYFRNVIEEWKLAGKINENEYCYLLACLIESVSAVSNTAGVYGAFLKKWDSRALKDIIFHKVASQDGFVGNVDVYNDKIENIIEDVSCDILYMDPPYTQNQYGTQYHLLETLILNDNPSISKVTGSRSTAPMRSDWSKEYKVNILFDRVLAKTKAKYVILSYNNDGFMSKEYIEAALKRYGKTETYECRKISYKKYQNWKSQNEKEHFEYLFFAELKDKSNVVYESPLNYTGSKNRIANEIKNRLPANMGTFVDAFGGGFNVGINVHANRIIYNDINPFVMQIIRSFRDEDTYQYLLYIRKIEKKFGLEKANAEAYLSARNYYNSLQKEKRDPKLLFTIILYGYQQQIRFNSSMDFNNPVGMRWFNDRVLEKMISFSRAIKEQTNEFVYGDYQEQDITEDMFLYLDPPYKLTTGAYNDGKRGFKGWDDSLEADMFTYLDKLNNRGIKFMLSYVVEHKGQINDELLRWIQDQGYKLVELGDILGISGSRRKEILVLNYEAQRYS